MEAPQTALTADLTQQCDKSLICSHVSDFLISAPEFLQDPHMYYYRPSIYLLDVLSFDELLPMLPVMTDPYSGRPLEQQRLF